MKRVDYSVVVPVFNSEMALSDLTDQLMVVFKKMQVSWEVIFVDDHSTDKSWHIIKNLKAQHPGIISGYHFARNFGQHNATLCGIQHAQGEYIITMDDDLQHSPTDIPALIEMQKKGGFELVYGIFSKRKQKLFRRIQSRFLRKAGKRVNEAPGNGSSFRLISARLAKEIKDFSMRFVYLDDMFYWHTQSIGFAEVTHYPSTYRKSGYTSRKLAGILYNLFIFNSGLPLKIMTFGGLAISALSAFTAIVFIIRRMLYDVPMGFTSTIVTILFSTSLIIFSLGVIGEYLRRMYLGQTGHPAYSVDMKTEALSDDEN